MADALPENNQAHLFMNPLIQTLCLLMVPLLSASGETIDEDADPAASNLSPIWINQVGYHPQQQKWAVISDPQAKAFQIVEAEGDATPLFEGTIGEPAYWQPLQAEVALVDFSDFKTPGRFLIKTDTGAISAPLIIRNEALRELSKAAIKAFYFSRASFELEPAYAGKWARPAGHPDDHVLIHASAASESRPEGSVVSAPKGWYDAGDYNKYIVNSGISTYTLLLAYRMFPEYYNRLDLNIPESGNDIPDLLDEVKWNLDWMLAMQDPDDGGVYHKLTTLSFEPAVMPHLLNDPRYMVMKSTPAAYNFAAVMAMAHRVWKPFDAEYANTCLQAAIHAWEWAEANPDILYKQPEDVHTGHYGDRDIRDEHFWAATELYLATDQEKFIEVARSIDCEIGVPGWNAVGILGHYSLAVEKQLPESISVIREQADKELRLANRSAAKVGMENKDYIWGSNAVAANKSMLLLIAHCLTGDTESFSIACDKLNYILGKNPTGYCFVTGFGARPVMNPHYRPSMGDDLKDPHPGFLSGGPNHQRHDVKWVSGYLGDAPAMAFCDEEASYATNEIAINWNAPLSFITGAVEAILEASAAPEDPTDE